MQELKQSERSIGVTTPFGPDKLVLESFSGEERMSELFSFDLQMLSEAGDLAAEDIVGKSVDFYVRHETEDTFRYFNGIVSRFTYLGQGDRAHMYRARVVPWLWLLTKAADCKVHETNQEKGAKEIIDAIFSDFGFTDYRWDLNRPPEKRPYCMQYRETYYDFISRLLAEEGIYFYFAHSEGKHELVLTDKAAGVFDCADAEVRLNANLGQTDSTDNLSNWHHSHTFTSGKYSHTDYDFENPKTDLSVEKQTKISLSAAKDYELYDHPGGYLVKPAGDKAAEWRIEAEEYLWDTVTGSSRCRSFSPGGRFEVAEHHNAGEAGKKWVLIAVQHRAQGGSFVTGGGTAKHSYSNTFHAIPADAVFRPTHTRTKPQIHGIQSAVVVGPSGEEIYTDKYGRIKVQFHWDRDGKKDEKSSMWVRVASPWAGQNWGMIHIPRIGQEVIINFLDGDLDRPVCMGMLYNADNMPPYALPENQTQSGIKTRSSKSGDAKNFNELRFEDKKGHEEVYIHAEKDFNCVIENNETRKVGFEVKDKGDQIIEIYNDQKVDIGIGSGAGSQTVNIEKDRTVTLETGNDTLEIKKGNLAETIKQGNQTTQLDKGNQTTTLKMGNQTIELDQGNQATTLKMGNQTTTLKMGNQTTKLNLGKVSTEAMQAIELKVGPNSIKIDPSGITIKGLMVKIEGSAMTNIKAPMTQIDGSGMLMMKGGIAMIN